MTTIRTTCPRCSEVDLEPEKIILHIDESAEGTYRFICPTCENTIEKPANRKVIALLLAAGVELDEEQPVAKVVGHELNPAAPFTFDDLIEFHELLRDDERLAQEFP